MAQELNIVSSSGASWEGEQHTFERTVTWNTTPCGEVQALEHVYTADSHRYGQGEQTVWQDGDALHRLTVETQTTVTLETLRVSELSPLERELEDIRCRLGDARSRTEALRELLECWQDG